MFIVTNFLTTIFLIWTCAKIWQSSALLAVVSFFFFPAALIPLVQNWGDEENDIRLPFFLTLATACYSVYSIMSYVGHDEQDTLLQVLQSVA